MPCIFRGCYDAGSMVTLEEPTRLAPPAGTGHEKEQAVQRMFSAIARYYDLNNSLLSLGLHHSWKRKAVELLVDPPHPIPLPQGARDTLRLPPGARSSLKLVLDVGAGTGDLALLAVQRLGQDTRVVAADLNVPMLAVGLRKVRRAGLQRQIVCVQSNAERLCVPDEAFDAVTTGFCLRNVGNLPQALREIVRVLRPGGRLVCLEFSRPVSPWLRRLYDWYSFTLLPWIGTTVSGDTTGVYEYLPASIRTFPEQEGLSTMLREVGFGRVDYHNLSGGIVAIHVAVK